MLENSNLTDPSWAAKMMGSNFISLEEAMTIFPTPDKNLAAYDTVPFSKDLIYRCSDPENPFILVPLFQRYGKNRTLNLVAIRRLFSHIPDMFISPGLFTTHAASLPLSCRFCMPNWYLISKKTMTSDEIKKFLRDKELGRQGEDWHIEHSIHYVCAWLLFLLIRKESVFENQTILTEDLYPGSIRNNLYLRFSKNQVRLTQWNKKHSQAEASAAISIKPYTK